ncbi:MAG: hypothetical protein QG574_5330 [Cyanobacteriota bacterium erpe_2018_sw_21hr_WHONDRS-SW48-000092_B_bin.40]|nr:hypothetical protein [Cyanobacteriota bacterium erpe_2018_sw_21hr_WHONDRS-SW48-000092_B_bin.40]
MKRSQSSLKRRNQSGVFLIELLVSLVIASVLALALCASIGEYMRLTSTIEGKELAAIMAQEVLERVKSMPFDSKEDGIRIDNSKTYDMIINDSDPAPLSPPCQPLARPLLLNTQNLQYSTTVADTSSSYHKFKGQVTLKVSDGPLNPVSNKTITGTKLVTVHVTWSEPNSTVPKNLEVKTVLYRYGIQHHGG